ncbi:MAG TPA: HTTM domain-containing protein [Candidatus Nitrosocosmicus sp.]|nr:HTTM domain-containing protein [Candidatus Nitrosocosmicus sp.]
MSTPPRDAAAEHSFGNGWFVPVPSCRFATFRVALAFTTLVFHVPKFNGLLASYAASAFHVPPAFAWLPILTPAAAAVLALLQYAAAAGLLLGLAVPPCGWFLAGLGFYVMLLDPEHYSHNAHFHVTLLALLGCSQDGLSLARLVRERAAAARCAAWPERLARLQVGIVFFYAAFDKVFSPFWGLEGTRLGALRMADHGLGFGLLQRLNRAVMRTAPAALSVATIAVEFFLAAAAVFRPFWRAGLVVGFMFVAYLEFLVAPGLFTWDMLAAGILFLPAGDGGWQVFHDSRCAACRRRLTLLSWLDWLRRCRYVVRGDASDDCPGIALVSPRGRPVSGFEAVRVLPAILAGPTFIVMALSRFGGGYLAARIASEWDDLPYVLLLAYLALWMPGVARYLGRPLHAALGAHARAPRNLDPPSSPG